MHLVSRLVLLLVSSLSVSFAQTPIEDVSNVWSKSKISVAADTSIFGSASKIVRAMAHMPAPDVQAQQQRADPQQAPATCDRDYSAMCPEQFENIGPVKDGDTQYCTGGSDYKGPCDGAFSFDGMAPSAKARWSEMCLSNWPCTRCTRDYRIPCPEGWRHREHGVCVPSTDYFGPCKDMLDFGSYNEAMREVWSNQCGAYWKCDDGWHRSQHVHLAIAALERTTGNAARSVSFLAAKSIPVDGYKIRNSLYLTQPMREPAQASVNVIVHEDISRMQEESKYKGMEDQAMQLHRQVQDMLRAMSAKTAK